MRVALLTNNLVPPREGIGRHVLEVARRLRRRGHEPLLVARGGRAFGRWESDRVEGVAVRRYPWRPLRPFHQWLAGHELARWLAEARGAFDLLHVHLPLLPPLATSGLPVVVTVHSPMLSDSAAIAEPGLRARLMRWNARLVGRRHEQAWLDRATRVTAVSVGVRAELERDYVLGGRPVEIVRNGVDCAFFGARARRPEPLVLYVGRLGYRKGLFRLLEAFALLSRDLADRLVLVGEGPLRRRLAWHASRLGLERRVRFAGFAGPEGVREWLARAACFVNPADYESGPLTVLEAMAAGTPVVSTRTGLVAELGPDAPFLVARPTADDLAGKLALVLSDPFAAERRAAAGRALVARDFGWDAVTDAYLRLYGAEGRAAA